MEPKVFVATLVNGITYCHGHEIFEAGKPRQVTKELADALLKVVDVLPVAFGNKKLARRKFVIQDMQQLEATALIEKYNPDELKSKQEKFAEGTENLEVVDAITESDLDDGSMLLDAQVSMQQGELEAEDISDTKVDSVEEAPPKKSRTVKPKE